MRVSSPASCERKLVLVVEDHLEDWKLYGKILWYNGYDVLHADCRREALRLALRFRPDLMLVDLMLPDGSGLELCHELRAEAATAHVPVVMLSARAAREYEEPAVAAGCARYLEKPISPAEVVRAVAREIGYPPASGETPAARKYSPMEDDAEPPGAFGHGA